MDSCASYTDINLLGYALIAKNFFFRQVMNIKVIYNTTADVLNQTIPKSITSNSLSRSYYRSKCTFDRCLFQTYLHSYGDKRFKNILRRHCAIHTRKILWWEIFTYDDISIWSYIDRSPFLLRYRPCLPENFREVPNWVYKETVMLWLPCHP